jgi:adenylate cyclase
MKRHWQRVIICAAIAVASVAITVALSQVRFFQLLNLKAQDAHFLIRGRLPTPNIVLVGIDQKALDTFPELSAFWQPYFGDAMRAAADAGARVFVLDKTFAVPVTKYEPDNDSNLADAFNYASAKMPVISAFVPAMSNQQDPRYTVPINMMAMAFGTAAYANLTDDSDGSIRRQQLIEAPKAGVPTAMLTRSMSLRAAEKLVGQDAEFRNGKLYLAGREIPLDADLNMTINFAGPPGNCPPDCPSTFQHISMADFIAAYRKHDLAQLRKWVSGKAVFLGPDDKVDDRYPTPFYSFLGGTQWTTPGVEIHANSLQTILNGQFLQPVPQWIRVGALTIDAGLCLAVMVSFPVSQIVFSSIGAMFFMLLGTHVMFRSGWILSTSEMFVSFLLALVGGIVYRFATAEKKSTFFKSAVALFVGKQFAQSIEQSQKIGLTGKRQMVTIMFTDIRGFTAFCESKDPAVVVDLLNDYMKTMVSIIVKHHGQVNKFIGDGILAVFSDDDEGAKPGDHARRAVLCATEIVTAPSQFKTGSGMHTGEVVIGNVGSSDKMEFTVLGDTVNLASRLESLNKEHKTRLLLSEATLETMGGGIDTVYLGAVPVRGKTEPMKLYTVASLMTDETRAAHAGVVMA